MRIRKKFLRLLICFLITGLGVNAQELNCNVTVYASPKAQYTNTQLLKSMETSIKEFMNTRKWTNDRFENYEKIQCNIQVTIDRAEGNDFIGTMQVSAIRPVYGSNYTTTTFNFNDKNVGFSYIEFQNMDYQEGNYSSELTSLLAYYANIIIGYDYDSYSELGGTPFFQKAENIVNVSQSSPNKEGWSAIAKDIGNRYYLASQLTDDRYQTLRKAIYNYHRAGLDYMFQDNEKGLNSVMNTLTIIKEFNSSYPNSIVYKTFFVSKWQELINLYALAPNDMKQKARNMLTSMDIVNAQRYEDGLK
jgi:hypothetical protein